MPICLRVAALLLVGLLLSGCGPEPPDALRFGLSSAPVTLDPRFATDASSTRINRLLFRRLVDFDERMQPVPSLARWERLTPTHYRFVLGPEGRQFHDGTRLVAGDVEALYGSILDPATASPHRGSLEVVDRVEALDHDTVDFHLNRADPLFPGRLVVGIPPADLLTSDRDPGRAPVGSGPFRFEAWPDETRLVIRRLSDDQRVEFLRVPDPTMRVLKLVRREVDMLQSDLPPELVAWLDRRPDVVVHRTRGTRFAYLGFNLQDPVAGDPRVRRAIAHALDREAIIRHVLGGSARPASALLPPDHWAGHPGLGLLEHNPDTARALLREAGYEGGRPVQITYKTSSDPFRIRVASVIQDQLRQVGVQVRLQSYDWGTFYADVKAGRFQMYSLAWVGVKMPDIFRYVFHSGAVPPAGANRGRFMSVSADRLIEAAEVSVDMSRQAELYRALQSHLLSELPYVPLWYEDNVFVAGADIEGYEARPDGNYDGLITTRRGAGW